MKSGFDGLPVGVLREALVIPHSSMTHRISSLVEAGLIKQQREGRILRCVRQYDRLWDVIAYLQRESCLDERSAAAGGNRAKENARSCAGTGAENPVCAD
ncbi:MAG: winged helix-turn-helix domain-containing protein [Leisingera sp.]